MSEHDHAWWKLGLVWAGTIFGSITLQQWVLLATLVYTLVNLFFLVRDKWWRDE